MLSAFLHRCAHRFLTDLETPEPRYTLSLFSRVSSPWAQRLFAGHERFDAVEEYRAVPAEVRRENLTSNDSSGGSGWMVTRETCGKSFLHPIFSAAVTSWMRVMGSSLFMTQWQETRMCCSTCRTRTSWQLISSSYSPGRLFRKDRPTFPVAASLPRAYPAWQCGAPAARCGCSRPSCHRAVRECLLPTSSLDDARPAN